MLANLGYGWAKFTLGEFIGEPSYLTDVPINLLDSFIEYLTSRKSITYFDEEGTEFELIFSFDNLYIISISYDDVYKLYQTNINNTTIKNLTTELINDIESDIDGWIAWNPGMHNIIKNSTEYITRKLKLQSKCKQLKKLIDNR